MAKKSLLARDAKKAATVERLAPKVSALKEVIKGLDEDLRYQALITLNKLPRNFSRCRINKRCQSCGRPRGVYRHFGLCRICLRQAAMRGDIPGLVKASW